MTLDELQETKRLHLIGHVDEIGCRFCDVIAQLERTFKALKIAKHTLIKVRDYCEHDGTSCLELCDCSTFMSLKASQAIKDITDLEMSG